MSTYDLAVLRKWRLDFWTALARAWIWWRRTGRPLVYRHAPARIIRARAGWWAGAFTGAYGCDILWGRGVAFLVLGALGVTYFTLLYHVDEAGASSGQPVAGEQTRRW